MADITKFLTKNTTGKEATLIEFQVSEHITCMDSNSVNRLFKNPKHITAISFSSKSTIYPSASSSLAFVMQISDISLSFLTTTMQIGKCQVGWRGDCCNVFWIPNQSVYRINCPCM